MNNCLYCTGLQLSAQSDWTALATLSSSHSTSFTRRTVGQPFYPTISGAIRQKAVHSHWLDWKLDVHSHWSIGKEKAALIGQLENRLQISHWSFEKLVTFIGQLEKRWTNLLVNLKRR